MTFRPYLNQEFNALKSQFINENTHFIDNTISVDYPGFFFTEQEKLSRQSNPGQRQDLHLSRPHDICKKLNLPPPRFIIDTISPDDINQGSLGDCWMLSSLSSLSDVPEYIRRVVPIDQKFDYEYCGLFHFRFWHLGEWYDVVVDDLLRIDPNTNMLWNAKGINKKANEFWVPLLEKAFAKLKGSYSSIEGGLPNNALITFTGGTSERISIRDTRMVNNVQVQFYNEKLWDKLFESFCSGALLNSVIFDQSVDSREVRLPNGLYKGHAYSIIGVYEFLKADNGIYDTLRNPNSPIVANQKRLQIVQLRNPHGNNGEKAYTDDLRPIEWQFLNDGFKKLITDPSYLYKGNFFIPFGTYKENFHSAEIVNVHMFGLQTIQNISWRMTGTLNMKLTNITPNIIPAPTILCRLLTVNEIKDKSDIKISLAQAEQYKNKVQKYNLFIYKIRENRVVSDFYDAQLKEAPQILLDETMQPYILEQNSKVLVDQIDGEIYDTIFNNIENSKTFSLVNGRYILTIYFHFDQGVETINFNMRSFIKRTNMFLSFPDLYPGAAKVLDALKFNNEISVAQKTNQTSSSMCAIS